MTITVGQLGALATKSIEASGGVADAVWKNNWYMNRLYSKKGSYSGTSKTFPFQYFDETQTNGKFYTGGEALSLDQYDPYTELEFFLKEVEETLVITHRDLALNTGKEARINLLEQRLMTMEKAMRQRMAKAIFGTGAVANEFVGMQAFLKSSSVNYGGLTDTDIPLHVAYVSSNGGTLRALSTALIQATIGGASEGEERPSIGLMTQLVMNQFIELIKPHQRTAKENLNGLGHAGPQLTYSGLDFAVDNLAPASSIVMLNEKHVKLYAHPEYDMKVVKKEDLETMDAIMDRLFFKGLYACNVLRYQGWLKDVIV